MGSWFVCFVTGPGPLARHRRGYVGCTRQSHSALPGRFDRVQHWSLVHFARSYRDLGWPAHGPVPAQRPHGYANPSATGRSVGRWVRHLSGRRQRVGGRPPGRGPGSRHRPRRRQQQQPTPHRRHVDARVERTTGNVSVCQWYVTQRAKTYVVVVAAAF